jgi:hypothetical protein
MLKTVGNPSTRFGNQTISDGDLIIGTAGKGIDFSANTNAAGMTSELLDHYEEGTFTPTFANLTIGDGTTWGRYTKIGRVVHVQLGFKYGSTSSISGSIGDIGGLPFSTANVASNSYQLVVGSIFKPGDGWYSIMSNLVNSDALLYATVTFSGSAITSTVPTTFASGTTFTMSFTYEAA